MSEGETLVQEVLGTVSQTCWDCVHCHNHQCIIILHLLIIILVLIMRWVVLMMVI